MFINTLTALLYYTNTISVWEISAIFIATFFAVYLMTPKSVADAYIDPFAEEYTDTSIYLYIHLAWLGRQSLARAFVPFFVIMNSVLIYIDYRVANSTFTMNSWMTMHIIAALPILWWTVAVWRCSQHNTPQLWACGARFGSICLYYELSARYIIYYYYPQIWFNCRQLAINYGDCF